MSPAPTRKHQTLSRRLFLVVNTEAEAGGLGEVFYAPADVRLSPHDVVQPDLLFIRRDRLHLYQASGVVDGPPDLVVEILSPSSRSIDLLRKPALYARGGLPEYWQADPDRRTLRIFVHRDGQYDEVLTENGLLRSTVLPGLVIDPAALFANLP